MFVCLMRPFYRYLVCYIAPRYAKSHINEDYYNYRCSSPNFCLKEKQYYINKKGQMEYQASVNSTKML